MVTDEAWTTNDAQTLTHDYPPGPVPPWDRWPLGDPDGVEVGTLWVRTELGGRRTVCERADPRVTVSESFVAAAGGSENVIWDGPWRPGTFVTFRFGDRDVVYRVRDHDPTMHAWLLEWPD